MSYENLLLIQYLLELILFRKYQYKIDHMIEYAKKVT
jgi:hypothetical protein